MHAYPKDLARLVRARWDKRIAPEGLIENPRYTSADKLPPLRVLDELLSAAFHASLLRDEGRPIRFRLIFRDPERFAPEAKATDGLQVLRFNTPLPLQPHELRRLAPASPLEQSLIGVRLADGASLEVWGLVHSGEQWLRALEGLRKTYNPLPASLVVSVVAPGHVAVAKGSLTVARLLGGRLGIPKPGLLDLSELRHSQDEIELRLVEALEAERHRSGAQIARISLQLVRSLRRLVALRIACEMRRLQHGGAILMLPAGVAADSAKYQHVLKIKYSFEHGESRGRLRVLTLGLLKALAMECGVRFGPNHEVTWKDYLGSVDPAVLQCDETISEFTKSIACLSAVDGAVVIGQPLELLGFGAEVAGDLPAVERVGRALDPRFRQVRMESALNVGTRHRSTYRFCNALPGASALVVSQDGSMRFVGCFQGQVVYSEDLSSGTLNA